MDGLTCLGCSKAFTTQKSLSNREAQCDASKSLDADIYKQQHRLEKRQKKKRRCVTTSDTSSSPEHGNTSCNARRLSPDDQMDVDNDPWLDHDHMHEVSFFY
jgi:hypothetical protein